MIDLLRKTRESSLVRYIFAGGVAYCIEMAFIFASVSMGLSKVASVAISFWIGFIVAFVLQKFLAFQNNSHSTKTLLRQSIAYGGLVIINYVFTLGFVYMLTSMWGVLFSRTVALLITTGWNYLAYKYVIFKH